MPTRTKKGIVTVATIIGAVCALVGGFLNLFVGPGIGFPMWFGLFVVLAPVSGGFFSFISSLISLSWTEKKPIIYSVSAVVGFLVGYLPFNYMSM